MRVLRFALAMGLALGSIALNSPADAREPRMVLASLAIGEAEDFKDAWDEVEPRADLKNGSAQFPVLDDSRKGDPALGLRPAFETRLRREDAGGVR